MKNRLFGQLGSMLKNNGVTLVLVGALALAGVFTYQTVNNINKQLDEQHLQNIRQSSQPQSQQEVEDVQTEQENVPLPSASQTQRPASSTAGKSSSRSQRSESRRNTTPRFTLPVSGKIFNAFSGDELVYNRTMDDWRTHNGIDISAVQDEAVKAGAAGTVTKVYTDGLLGTVVEINHGDFTARYCGLARQPHVKEGDSVSRGQAIGTVGQVDMEVMEESHIHLEIIMDGAAVNPDTVLK